MAGRIITEREQVGAIAARAKRVAVLGIKTERQAGQPAFYVPAYLQRAGVELVPVPVYLPEVTEFLGVPVVRRVQDIAGHIDILDVFRRPEDLPAHLEDILVKHPPVVWLQSGIANDAFARSLTEHGIDVVQDRCLMVEHRANRQRA
jgi:predicted CoA-binding protein